MYMLKTNLQEVRSITMELLLLATDIPIAVLKYSIDELTHLILWLIHRKGDKSQMDNYRPISILPNIFMRWIRSIPLRLIKWYLTNNKLRIFQFDETTGSLSVSYWAPVKTDVSQGSIIVYRMCQWSILKFVSRNKMAIFAAEHLW